jgi:RNA:NAD 2'-phosphotransferase (TPT1/KptA family)
MPRDRQLVHLSETLADALSLITKKSDQPAVLRIDAAAARLAGNQFYREGKVYLTARVPAQFLTLEPQSSQAGR